ncbi:hypothetical protein Dimus_022549 [Dionaea muscipula]
MKSRQLTRGEQRGGAWRDEQGERRGVRCRRRSNIEADEIRLNHARFKPGWHRDRGWRRWWRPISGKGVFRRGRLGFD